MKRKYVTQQDDYSCGPIAIYNALIALQHPPSSLRRVRIDCDPHSDHGTLYINFNRTLRKYLPEITSCEYIRHPTYSQIQKHIKEGGVAIILEHWEREEDKGEHYYTIFGMEDDDFLVVNRYAHQNVQKITPANLKESLIKYQHKVDEEDLFFPTTWLLSNKNDI